MALPPLNSFSINFVRRALLRLCLGRFHFLIKIRPAQLELINHSFVTDEIDFAALISSKRSDVLRCSANLADNLKRAVTLLETKDAVRCVIAADINAVERRVFVAPVN